MARSWTSGRRAISSKACASMEIGKAAALHVPAAHEVVLGDALAPCAACGVVGMRVVEPGIRDPDQRTARGHARRPAAGAQEVGGVAVALESEQVGAEQAADDLPPPGQLGEDLVPRERDVREVADTHVRPQRAHHPGHELELVVVRPHGRAVGGLGGDYLGVPAVHPDIRVPPLTVELGLGDDVVVEGPQGAVAEALVVVGDLFVRQSHADQVHPVRVEWFRCVARRAGPADPGSLGGTHHRLESGHQTAGAGLPFGLAVRALRPVHRQAAGRHHEVVVAVCSRGPNLPAAGPGLSWPGLS